MSLRDFLKEIESRRKEIYKTGEDLARLMRIRLGDIAEVETYPGRSVILGGYGYLGTIDDNRKTITFFGNGSAVDYRSFDEVYQPLRDSGYEIERLRNERLFGEGDDSEVLNYIVDKGLAKFALDVAEGAVRPEAGYVLTDGERRYERARFMESAEALTTAMGQKGLGTALALNAAVQDGMEILQAAPSSKTSMDARIVAPFEWPEPEAAEPESPAVSP